MAVSETWRWRFLGFKSVAEGSPVQDWFDGLPEEDKYEIADLLGYLQNFTNRPWPEAVFDPLRGAGGISEIKIPNIRCSRGGEVVCITYRIYGFFGPKGYSAAYTLLHGKEKDVKNDIIGKRIAKGRLDEVGRGTATVHEFSFEEEPRPKAEEKPRRPN